MNAMRTLLCLLIRDHGGQEVVEYALAAALLAVAGIISLNALQGTLNGTYVSWDSNTQNLWNMPAPGTGASR
jgi:Flp pilus assembly pilin Flp